MNENGISTKTYFYYPSDHKEVQKDIDEAYSRYGNRIVNITVGVYHSYETKYELFITVADSLDTTEIKFLKRDLEIKNNNYNELYRKYDENLKELSDLRIKYADLKRKYDTTKTYQTKTPGII